MFIVPVLLALAVNYVVFFYASIYIQEPSLSFAAVHILPAVAYLYLGWSAWRAAKLDMGRTIGAAVLVILYDRIVLRVSYVVIIFSGSQYPLSSTLLRHLEMVWVTLYYYLPVGLLLSVVGYSIATAYGKRALRRDGSV